MVFNQRDADLILKIHIPRQHIQDRTIWGPEVDGKFSLKSCYKAVCGELREEDSREWSKIWQARIPPKVKSFMWQTCSKCLPTKDLLRLKKVYCDEKCLPCSHGSINNFIEWINYMISSLNKDQIGNLFMVCWNLWNLRNNIHWNNQSLESARITVRRAQNVYFDWFEANKNKQEGMKNAIDTQHAKLGFGWVLRDEQGHFIAAKGLKWRGSYSSKEAEAVSIRESLTWLKSHAFDKIIVETDSLPVVQGLKSTGFSRGWIRDQPMYSVVVAACMVHDVLVIYDEFLASALDFEIWVEANKV
ncbi:uncharacterized protein LOC116004068 [Ipomoea triloba]|uniref:uncharacterized protein LOC116004068 n=1 Tax=Ipomoea triloba TaxID=35885 RepID=UPI00125CD61F|nr:uncharacterized protein LOC116004068 [Ipomoea triloba]